jgi:hypothetical protein
VASLHQPKHNSSRMDERSRPIVDVLNIGQSLDFAPVER